ncbi:beta-ketoacyl synthase chain length factor [Acinetobacter apis]|uniref:Beta-ketoacyl synthase, N-terminal domain n=1 Tax=Acinetobacter apis TaxID=1229165 RepID=A0A217EHM7_9GAMM|nr:beta-ketoacyl synthase chain length factor [Acinetobacter apis]SNQ29864.1 Beta-ketoacyl synthase, N-terminal domain [Acinetobacter apis]
MKLQLQVEQLFKSVALNNLHALEKIPAMQRRRLSPLAKLALNSALNVLSNDKVDYIVWGSRFGDEAKTLTILQDVLRGEIPSPTQFSVSVHNAISGLYSILNKDRTRSTSLSATLPEAVIEAYAFLKTQPLSSKALIVYYEAPIPNVYSDLETFESFAVACIVSLDQPNISLNINQLMTLEPSESMAEFESFWGNKTLLQSDKGVWVRC